jgi:hypothetical protein
LLGYCSGTFNFSALFVCFNFVVNIRKFLFFFCSGFIELGSFFFVYEGKIIEEFLVHKKKLCGLVWIFCLLKHWKLNPRVDYFALDFVLCVLINNYFILCLFANFMFIIFCFFLSCEIVVENNKGYYFIFDQD